MSDNMFIKKGFDQTLSHVIEECGEVLAAAGKLQRHGIYSVNPLLPVEQQETNIHWLIRELVDLKEAIERFELELDPYV